MGMTTIFLAQFLFGLFAAAQNASEPSLAEQVKKQYKVTKLGADSNVLEEGSLLVIQAEGILGVPSASVDLCPATYEDGAIHAPSADEKAHCGKNVRKLNAGERVYVLKIDVDSKKDRVSLLVVECGSCNGSTQLASYKSPIVFQFPEGYLAAADAGQIEDVIAQVLTIDNGYKTMPQQASVGQSPPGVLTNEEVIKLVQAKLPDSVVLAKIQSSNCDFDTSIGALIKLKRSGASESVLKAVVDSKAQSNSPPAGVDNVPVESVRKSDVSPECANYDACIKVAKALLESSQWDRAFARFQEASQLDGSKGDSWAGIGYSEFQLGQYDDAVKMWDKALQLGSTLVIAVCHAGIACNDTGNFLLSVKEVSFVNKKGEKEFAAVPSAVTSEGAVLFSGSARPAYYLQIRFGKNWRFYYTPKNEQGGLCLICSEPGPTQQKTFADYVHNTLVRMAAGDFGSQPNKP
jgi:tetratricopeptide (TPR) repeat protein